MNMGEWVVEPYEATPRTNELGRCAPIAVRKVLHAVWSWVTMGEEITPMLTALEAQLGR